MTSFTVPVLSSQYVEIYSRGRTDYIPNDKTLFVLGGRAPEIKWILDLEFRNNPGVWAVDSGVRVCRAAGIIPSTLLGDRDSASPDDWAWALSQGAAEKLYPREKDKTDFQLALSSFEGRLGASAPMPVLIVSGCFGGALDHLMSIFNTLAFRCLNFFRCMIDEAEGVYFLSSGEETTLEFSRVPEAVSLISVTDICRGVDIAGVKWPLSGATIERKYPWTVSNETVPNASGMSFVTVFCESGVLAAYWRF
jgi:thiamine pyrophosphokinase